MELKSLNPTPNLEIETRKLCYLKDDRAMRAT